MAKQNKHQPESNTVPGTGDKKYTGQIKEILQSINSGVSVVEYGDDGKVLLDYANDRYYALFGYTREQFRSELKDPLGMLYPDDRERVASVINVLKQTHSPVTFEYRVVRRDGTTAHLHCSSSIAVIEGLSGCVMMSIISDITESVLAEHQALVTDQRLSAIIGSISCGITAFEIRDDGSAGFIFMTEKYCDMLGYTREQYIQEVTDPFSLIHPEDSAKVREQSSALKTLGESVTLQFRAVRRDGQIIWLKDCITLMNFADSPHPVQLGVFTDITDLVKAEMAEREHYGKIAELMNTTPAGIAMVEVDPSDVKGTLRTVYYNDRFFSYSEYGRDEYDTLLKKDEMSFVCQEDIPTLLASTGRIAEGEIGTSEECTVRCRTKSGGYRWLLLTGQLVSKKDSICSITISIIDITERKEAADKLRVSEEMLRIASEIDHRVLVIYDVKANTCKIESRNLYSSKYEEVFHNIPESLLERGIAAKESEKELCCIFDSIRQGEALNTVSLMLQTAAGKYQWFECNATTIFDADGKPDHGVLVLHNIMEQRIKEAVYRKWQQSIESRPKDSYTLFRCNLSRESVSDERDGDLLYISFDETETTFNERVKKYTEQCVAQADRKAFISLINSDTLLAMYYRGEHTAMLEYRETARNGEVMWRRLTAELVEYLNTTDIQAFLLFEDIDSSKKSELRIKELADTDPLTGALNRNAFFDRVNTRIEEEPTAQHAMFMIDMDGFKLVNDSLGHAVGDQALMDVTEIIRSLLRPDDLVCRLGGDEFLVRLNDTNYSAIIEKTAKQICEQLAKTFALNVQVTASLGIAVYPRDGQDAERLYHNSDSALYRVKSSGKNGFSFYSAVNCEDSGNSEVVPVDTNVVRQSAASKRRMLIVDDDELGRSLLYNMFKDEYLTETAKNGNDALLLLRHFGAAISVVLLDLKMPGISGLEVLKRMQNNAEMRTVPVIIVSADDDYRTSIDALEHGAADYVTKPVDPNLIRIRVKSAINKADNERLRAQNSYLLLQRDEELKYHTVLESTGTVVVEYNWRTHVFIYDNTITKYLAGDYDNRPLWRVFLSDMVADSSDVKSLQASMMTLANDRENNKISRLVILKTPAGEKHWFRMNVYKQTDDFGLAEKMIITFNDVHDEVTANDKLLFQATHDELTGLYNRSGFLARAEEMISAKPEGYYVMSSIDIEKFKVINDQYGTIKGDKVLCAFAEVLRKFHSLNESICCRVFADSFAILYPQSLIGSKKLEQAHRAAESVDSSLPALSISIGRCPVDDKSLDVSAIYDRSAIARETVKGRYDIHIATFDESMRTAILRGQEITGQMRSALKGGQFEVWLQPQFNHVTGKLSGSEALVRWRHPAEGIIPPTQFIPVFEKNGFVYEVDKFVWEQVCVLLRRWIDSGMKPVPVSVNVSRYDVFRKDLTDVICGLLEKYNLPADMLRLEITESAFAESAEQIISVIKSLISHGFTVEIDDFGSGYSSLNTLKDVPAQVLKMDMRFFEENSDAERGGNIVESVVRMSRWLGMSVIAEGVETIEQADYLKSIGCETIQGYLYSKPVPVDEYEKIMARSEKEPKLLSLTTVESWNNNAFWNPRSMETLIFNSYVGGACIFEFDGKRSELLRFNDEYARIFGTGFKKVREAVHHDSLMDLSDESREVFLNCLTEATETKKEASCEMSVSGSGDTQLYIRLTVRQIAQAGVRRLYYCVVSDITAQRTAERREKEYASRITALMDNMNGGITAVSTSSSMPVIIFANDCYYRQLGYTPEQFRAEVPVYFNVIHPDDRNRVWSQVKKTLTDHEPAIFEYRCITRDKKEIYIQSNIAICHLDGIEEDVMITVETDITKQKRLEESLNSIMNNIDGGVAAFQISEGNLRFISSNEKYYELFGYTAKEAEEEHINVLDFVVPQDLPYVLEKVKQLKSTRKPSTLEYQIIRRDGERRYHRVNISLMHMEGYGDDVITSVATDITELHSARQHELETSAKLSAVLNHAGNGITVLALVGGNPRMLLANDRYYEIIGYTREEHDAALDKDMFALVYDEDRERVREQVNDTNSNRGMLTIEYRVKRMDGKTVWVRSVITITNLVGVDAPVQITLYSDITEEKEASDQLRFLNESAHDILAQPDSDQAVTDALGKLLSYFAGDRVYVIEIYYDRKTASNTYEVCAAGVSSEIDGLQEVPFEVFDYWITVCKRNEYVVIENVDMLDDSKAELRSMLLEQNIHSIMISPLMRDGELIGFVGVDNPTRAIDQLGRMNALGDYIAVLLTRRDLSRKIESDASALRKMPMELLENIPQGAALYEFDGKNIVAIHINKQYWKLVEREPVDYGDASVIGSILPDDRLTAVQEIQAAIRQGRTASVDMRIRCGESGYKPFKVSAKTKKQSNGKYLLYVSYTPISEQVMTMQDMITTALSAIMAASPDMSYVKDKSLRYVCASPSAAQTAGCANVREIVGKTDFELFDRELAEKYFSDDTRVIETGRPVINDHDILKTNDGIDHTIISSKFPILDANGNSIGLYGNSRDITKIKETESQLRFLSDSIPGGLASFEYSDGKLAARYFNDGFYRASGYSPEEYAQITASDPLSLIHPDDRAAVLSLIREQVEEKESDKVVQCDMRCRLKDGSYRLYSMRGKLMETGENKYVLNAVLFDIDERKKVEDQLRVSEEEYRIAAQMSGSIICRYSVADSTVTIPAEIAAQYDFPQVLEDVPYGRVRLGRISPDTAEAFIAFYESIRKGEKEGSVTYRKLVSRGWRWFASKFKTVFDESGAPVSAVVSFTDVSEQREQEISYTKWRQGLRERPEDSYTLFICDISSNSSVDSREGGLLKVNFEPGFFSFDDHTETYAREYVLEDDRKMFTSFLNADSLKKKYHSGNRNSSIEYREIMPHGEYRWLRLTVDVVKSPTTDTVEGHLLFEDIDKQKKADLLTLMRLETDPLTGVLNRTAFISRMDAVLKSHQPNERHALFMLDVDNFKHVNDTLGHGAGDKILCDLTAGISAILRRGDLLGRLGGDEFFVLLIDVSGREAAEKKAKEICALSFDPSGTGMSVTASVGIAMVPENGADFDTLYKKVDAALYRRKEQGKNGYLFAEE